MRRGEGKQHIRVPFAALEESLVPEEALGPRKLLSASIV